MIDLDFIFSDRDMLIICEPELGLCLDDTNEFDVDAAVYWLVCLQFS